METCSLLSTAVAVPLSRNSAWTKIVIRNVTIVLALALPAWLHAGETGHSTWGYDGDRGPLHWGKLGPEFSLCEKGMSQSPIDLLIIYRRLDLSTTNHETVLVMGQKRL